MHLKTNIGCGEVWGTTYQNHEGQAMSCLPNPLPKIPKPLYMCLNRIKSVLFQKYLYLFRCYVYDMLCIYVLLCIYMVYSLKGFICFSNADF